MPVGVPDSYSTPQDRPLDIKAGDGVLANDTNPAGKPKTCRDLVATTTNGTLTLEQNGAFRYTPTPGYVGSDTFTYTAGNGVATSGPVSVTIAVADVNDAPVAANDAYTTGEDTQLTVDAASGVLANDTDADAGTTLTAALVDDVATARLACRRTARSSMCRIRIRAARTASRIAPTTARRRAPGHRDDLGQQCNDPPVAANDTYSAQAAVALTVSARNGVLRNDTDVDNDPLTAALVSNVAAGHVAAECRRLVHLHGQRRVQRQRSFTYQANDGTTVGNPATVTIAVTVNGPPVATADTYTTLKARR